MIGALKNKVREESQERGIFHNRFVRYVGYLRYIINAVIAVIFIYSISIIWEISDFAFLQSASTGAVVSTGLNIAVIVSVAVLLWETINGFIEYSFKQSQTARLQTLLPIVRNVFTVAFIVLFSLVVLSELSIDIMPLLAGAGVLGIAIGFGAQTMVKDFITGFTIILEDLMQVGDVVRIADRAGWVKKITIRKVELRALDGTVYTIPFSEINIVENLSKEFSYYLMDIGVAYRENTDEVIGYVKEVDEDMRNDENYKDFILEPIDILGVDQFADSAVVIKARIKTKPVKQWIVGREFNRRMKIKFDEKGIEIPFPHQTVYFGEDKQGKAPPAYVQVENVDQSDEDAENDNQKKSSKKAAQKGKKDNVVDDDPGGSQDKEKK